MFTNQWGTPCINIYVFHFAFVLAKKINWIGNSFSRSDLLYVCVEKRRACVYEVILSICIIYSRLRFVAWVVKAVEMPFSICSIMYLVFQNVMIVHMNNALVVIFMTHHELCIQFTGFTFVFFFCLVWTDLM